METVVALALLASLALACWVAYVRSGARRWTIERDPLGEPPVRTVGAVAAVVVAVALLSGGGGGADHPSSMQQGFGDGDSAYTTADAGGGAAVASGTATANVVTAASNRPARNGKDRPTGATPGQVRTTDDAYAALVDRAHDAAERRGATIRWYPAIVRKAERASARRDR